MDLIFYSTLIILVVHNERINYEKIISNYQHKRDMIIVYGIKTNRYKTFFFTVKASAEGWVV